MGKDNIEKAITEVAGDVYDDAMSPSMKEVGGLLGAVIGFFNNVVAAPLHRLNAKYRVKTEAYIRNLEKRYLEIPEENRQEPPVKIVGPTLEALKYNLDEEDLKNMFTNLLVSSMDKTKSSRCHASYVEIVKQLDSIDANILLNLSRRKSNDIPMVKPKCGITLSINNRTLTGYSIGTDMFPDMFIGEIDGIDIFDISKSLCNLNRLGIINIFNMPLLDDLIKYYDEVESSQSIVNIFNDFMQTQPNLIYGCRLEYDRGYIIFTEYGKDFIDVVI